MNRAEMPVEAPDRPVEGNIKLRKRKRGEFAGRRVCIRNFCIECMGYQRQEVSRCTSKGCWLYPYRMGTSPEGAAKRGVDVI